MLSLIQHVLHSSVATIVHGIREHASLQHHHGGALKEPCLRSPALDANDAELITAHALRACRVGLLPPALRLRTYITAQRTSSMQVLFLPRVCARGVCSQDEWQSGRVSPHLELELTPLVKCLCFYAAGERLC